MAGALKMRNHGVNYNERRDILRKILSNESCGLDEAEFNGTIHQLEKELGVAEASQKPHPPIILGGAVGKKTARHIAEFCDGWMPLGRYGDIKKGMSLIQDAAAEIGEDLAILKQVCFALRQLRQNCEIIEQGLTRLILLLPAEDEISVLPILDEYSALI